VAEKRNRTLVPGVNDLATLYPEIAAQADGWDPSLVLAGSSLNLQWRCDKNHCWTARLSHRTKSGSGCPVCAGQKVLIGYNDLATTHPEIANEADGWDPKTVIAGSSKKRAWKCGNGHTWEAGVHSRAAGGAGCPVCSGRAVWKGLNDLATLFPAIAAQADGWDPATVVAGSGKRFKWRCENDHTWEATADQRTRDNTWCPYCTNQKVLTGENDLLSRFPEIAKQADGWDPATVAWGSERNLAWKCSKGHQWRAIVSRRTKIQSGCPVCSNKKVLAGFNDLATTDPELAQGASGWDPTQVTAGSNRRLEWKCPLGHTWMPPRQSRLVEE